MSGPLIHHVGVLVEDIEAAVERWSVVLGYTFSPIMRYRTCAYVDRSDPDPHFHDARIAISEEGTPVIELMEFTGEGTHARTQGEGVHHLGFLDHPDVAGRMTQLAALGIPDDGAVRNEAGDVILWFTDRAALNGVRLEYVSPDPQPIVNDDGSPVELAPAPGSA